MAISRDSKLLALEELNAGYSHAENLIAFCDTVLQKCNLTYADLDAVAVSKGPGSYTGLRIGVSAAKGFCYALDIPLISINTLQHLACQVAAQFENKAALFCPMLDARRMEVYCAIYDVNNREVKATAAEIITENSFSNFLKTETLVFFGDGASKCKELLQAAGNAHFIDDIFPSAKNMIALAEAKFAAKEFEDCAYFEPFYLKDFLIGGK